MLVRPALPDDHAAIAALLASAFDGPGEARLVAGLRLSGDAVAELVADEAGRIVGQVMLSRMAAPRGWLALAPVAVLPDLQGQGIGTALVRAALAGARTGGWSAAVVLGDPGYYGRFGFSTAAAERLRSPFPLEFTGVLALANPGRPSRAALRHLPTFAENRCG